MGGEGPRLMDGAVSQGCAGESVTVLAAVSCPDLCVAHLDGRGADWPPGAERWAALSRLCGAKEWA